MAADRCRTEDPVLREIRPGHWSACHFAEQALAAAPVVAGSGASAPPESRGAPPPPA
jgi:hypothetical protein